MGALFLYANCLTSGGVSYYAGLASNVLDLLPTPYVRGSAGTGGVGALFVFASGVSFPGNNPNYTSEGLPDGFPNIPPEKEAPPPNFGAPESLFIPKRLPEDAPENNPGANIGGVPSLGLPC
jgi:hypothetical protein